MLRKRKIENTLLVILLGVVFSGQAFAQQQHVKRHGGGHPMPRPPQAHVSHSSDGFHYYAHPSTQQTSTNTGHFYHHHNNNWHPNYNYYNNGYHFYPYVNYAPSGYLSSGYTPVQYNGQTYYNDNGTYYQDEGNSSGYTAVTPPVGAALDNVPTGAAEATINGNQYYLYNGVFYRRMGQNYTIVQSPL